MYQQSNHETRSVLAALRSLIPTREIEFEEAKRIAELQANRLLALWDISEGPVPSEVVRELPRIRVVYEELPVSGTSHWNGKYWIITLNRHEAWVRQRFTLMHEFKHIIDHGAAKRLYTGDRIHTADDQAEMIADYFAGCVLMPKRLLKRAWGDGLQTPSKLARQFKVSASAGDVRLAQTKLNVARDRCPRPLAARLARGRQPLYYRQFAPQGV